MKFTMSVLLFALFLLAAFSGCTTVGTGAYGDQYSVALPRVTVIAPSAPLVVAPPRPVVVVPPPVIGYGYGRYQDRYQEQMRRDEIRYQDAMRRDMIRQQDAMRRDAIRQQQAMQRDAIRHQQQMQHDAMRQQQQMQRDMMRMVRHGGPGPQGLPPRLPRPPR